VVVVVTVSVVTVGAVSAGVTVPTVGTCEVVVAGVCSTAGTSVAGTSDVQADKATTIAEINSFLIVFLLILIALNCADYLYLNITQFF
jgi:hypothetical protein